MFLSKNFDKFGIFKRQFSEPSIIRHSLFRHQSCVGRRSQRKVEWQIFKFLKTQYTNGGAEFFCECVDSILSVEFRNFTTIIFTEEWVEVRRAANEKKIVIVIGFFKRPLEKSLH